MKGVLQPDLSVSGNSSARNQRPGSGSRRPQRRHPDQEKLGNSKANIFGTSESNKPFYNSGVLNAGSNDDYSTQGPCRQGDGLKRKGAKNQDTWDQPVDVTVHQSPKGKGRRSAPIGVPQLNLGNLADGSNKLVSRVEPETHLHTPDSTRSDVSWGTPLHSSKQAGANKNQRFKEEQDYKVNIKQSPASKRPDDMPPLDLQASNDDPQAFRAARNNSNMQNDPLSGNHGRPWSTDPHNEHQYMKQRARAEQEQLYQNKKKDYIVETVMVDQLSRAAISDPEAVRPEHYSVNLGARDRKNKEFHNTRSVHSPGKSENLLSKRVRFGARLVTKNGHDIHRELNGFYFLADSTLTVYEFRQFGTRSSALPFIQKGCYSKVYGQSKGQPYSLKDITVGQSISFLTVNQNTLPQSVSMKPVVTLRITDVDEEAKEKLLFDGCQSVAQRREISDKLAAPPTEQQLKERKIIESIQGQVRQQLKNRAVKTLMGLGRHFNQLDKSGDGMLDKNELMAALQRYHITVPQLAFEDLWRLLDVNGDGALDYGEFVRGFIGEMNESRKSYVRKVFHKLDASKTGVVELNNIKKFFSAHKHPRVLTGEMKDKEIAAAFISSFDNCQNKGLITYGEFEDYYEGVSIAMDSDKEFIAMMKNCWGC